MKKKLILCAIFLFLVKTINAEEYVSGMILTASGLSEEDIVAASAKSELSLYDFYALSIRHTEKLLIAGENVVQADTLRKQAIGSWLPKISLNATKPFSESTSGGSTGSVASKSSAYIYARQPIITGLNEWSAMAQSKTNIEISRNTLIYTVRQQLSSIAQLYYLVCQLKSNQTINNEILELYKKNRNELSRRVAVGKNRPNDLLRTDTQISRLEAQIELNNAQLATAIRDLSTASGVSAKFKTSGRVILKQPEFKPDDLRSYAAKRIEVTTARMNVTVADLGINSAMGEHLPSIYLEGSFPFYPKNTSSDKFYGAVTASLPLFAGGTVLAKVNHAKSVKRQADLNLTQTLRLVEDEISNAYEDWQGSVKRTESFNKALMSAERNYNFTMKDYLLNLVTILDVITSLTDLQSTKSDYVTAVLTADLNRIKLGVAIEEFSNNGIALLKNASATQETQ